jgi:hypothetical protein
MSSTRDSFRDQAWLIIAVVSCVLLVFAPSDRSLWIDEGWSARIIMAPGNLAQWWQMTLHDSAAMATQFGHSLTGFLLGQVFGYSEQGLRMANLVWALAGVAAFALAGRKLGLPWLPLVFAANPFVWFYIDEVRPYAMQLAGGSWMMLAFLSITSPDTPTHSRTLWTNVFWFSCFVVYSASVLGAFSIAAASCAAVAALVLSRQMPQKGVWISSAIWGVVLVALTAFHAYFVFIEGKGGAKQWTPGFLNAAFALYEMSGLMGFGPSRDAIRAAMKDGGLTGLGQLFLPYLFSIGAYLSILAVAAYGILKKTECHGTQRTQALQLSAIVALGLTFMLVAAHLTNWPFWGRHVSPLFPFAVVAFALGFATLGATGRIGAVVWIALMLGGSLHARFVRTGHTDDYRSAARVASEYISAGEIVWWSAETLTPNYYNVFPISAFEHQTIKQRLPAGPSSWPRIQANGFPQCYSVLGLSRTELAQLPTPKLVITSKPDAWDAAGNLRLWLAEAGFVAIDYYPAFQVWERPSNLRNP